MPVNKIDPEALRRKYQEEREKRVLRGNRNSIDVASIFPNYHEDPWKNEDIVREAVIEEVDALMTGTGLAALVAAAHLTMVGVENFRLVDVASDFGGVWYWNRYPGIRCDIEAYIYMPLLEEVGTIPSEKYATGDEIFAHAQAIGRKFGLYEKTYFQTRILSATWTEADQRWHVKTDRGDLIKARFLLGTSGFLHVPKIPEITGIETFKGKMFHPSRWDFDYTGGSSKGNLTGLKGKRVGLLGTGATGIQIMPHLGEHAERAYLFQRTPAAVNQRGNKPTDASWYTSQEPGWQSKRADNFHAVVTGVPVEADLVDDCWTKATGKLFRAAQSVSAEDEAAMAEALQLYDYELMQGVRDRVDEIVNDPKTAESLKAWYNLFCKRPLYSDDYIESFNDPSVTLVDTDGRGLDRVTETGVVANGEHYELDCLIIASGFEVGTYDKKTATFPIIGRGGRILADDWNANGLHTVHGLWVHGYPNFQLVGTVAQGALSFNYVWLANEQAIHVANIISRKIDEGIGSIEVTKEAEQRWLNQLAEKYKDRSQFDKECTPGYYNNEGRDDPALWNNTYGGGAFEYFAILKEWRESKLNEDIVQSAAREPVAG